MKTPAHGGYSGKLLLQKWAWTYLGLSLAATVTFLGQSQGTHGKAQQRTVARWAPRTPSTWDLSANEQAVKPMCSGPQRPGWAFSLPPKALQGEHAVTWPPVLCFGEAWLLPTLSSILTFPPAPGHAKNHLFCFRGQSWFLLLATEGSRALVERPSPHHNPPEALVAQHFFYLYDHTGVLFHMGSTAWRRSESSAELCPQESSSEGAGAPNLPTFHHIPAWDLSEFIKSSRPLSYCFCQSALFFRKIMGFLSLED
jgi:hypothetical protein